MVRAWLPLLHAAAPKKTARQRLRENLGDGRVEVFAVGTPSNTGNCAPCWSEGPGFPASAKYAKKPALSDAQDRPDFSSTIAIEASEAQRFELGRKRSNERFREADPRSARLPEPGILFYDLTTVLRTRRIPSADRPSLRALRRSTR